MPYDVALSQGDTDYLNGKGCSVLSFLLRNFSQAVTAGLCWGQDRPQGCSTVAELTFSVLHVTSLLCQNR